MKTHTTNVHKDKTMQLQLHTKVKMYNVSKKNIPDIFSYNS